MTTFVGADDAARLLGVTKPTLYAYVSRGVVTRRTAPDGRTSLYARDELERLADRHRRRPAAAEPTVDIVIRSAITEIDDASVRYRGHDVAALARSHPFEDAAELLWTGVLPTSPPAAPPAWPVDRALLRRAREVVAAAGPVAPVTALALAAALVPDDDAPAAARRLLAVAPSLLGGPQRGTIAARLAAACHRSPAPSLVAAVDRALTLLADHELATSTVAVRVACSVGAAPAHTLATGLHTVAGRYHGGAGAAVAALLRDVERLGARDAVAAVRVRGAGLPGFGHAVYRTADPRLAPLLDAVRELPDPGARLGAVDALLGEAARVVGSVPNVDLAVGALLHVGDLPADAPLFAVARIAGWAAHHAEEVGERPVRYRGLTRR